MIPSRPASRRTFLVLAAVLLAAGRLAAAERTQVTLLSTTDMHGHIVPYDYYTDKPAEYGLAKISTLVKQVRKDAPQAILLDCGDTLQGTPLVYLHNRRNNTPVDPMMLVMNAIGYAGMTVGNHEYNFGLPVLNKARGEAKFPWLSANTYRVGTDECAYTPYFVREVNGARVAVIGLTTPAVPNWDNPDNYAGLEFRPLVSEAKKWVSVVREREHADVVVISVHCGLEEDLATGRTPPGDFAGENAALALAREVAGVDVIFLGHTHRDQPALVVNGVLLSQAGRWADRLVRVDVSLGRDGAGAWKVLAKAAQTLPVHAGVAADPAILALVEPYQRETQEWLSRPIGKCARTLDASNARFQDSALLDLVQLAQLEAGKADVSLAASFNPRARIPAGAVTVRDISGLYVYENTLYVVEVTGAQLKEILEHSARYFLPYAEGKSAADLANPAIPGYNFDVAEGVTYTIDLRRAPGDRILDLSFQGAPLAPDRKLRLATNNYRYNGGGGYTMLKGAKVLDRSSTEIRDLLIQWVEKHGDIPVEPSNNWRIVP